MNKLYYFSFVISLAILAKPAYPQHLWWKAPDPKGNYTCMYGEIKVIVSHPTIYFCGCNWWPGAPAGGYTGIQDNGPLPDGSERHCMIFSIWDTSKDLHPETVLADPKADHNRFGGEGTGAHTHLDYYWKVGEIYQFFAVKKQDSSGQNTLTSVYFMDATTHKWVHEATIDSPDGTYPSVKTFGGGLNAFLENWSGQDKQSPKLALYHLWLGTNVDNLTPVVSGSGDGQWGLINDWFYLAEGTTESVNAVIERLKKPPFSYGYGSPSTTFTLGKAPTISADTVDELKHLPKAPAADKPSG